MSYIFMILGALMNIDLDQYYTPRSVAEYVLSEVHHLAPGVCVDSTCGVGNLLEAACQVFGEVQCIGIDRDKNAITNLRRKNPKWILSVGDLLNWNSLKRTNAATVQQQCDLLVLNPPFSHNNKKHINIEYEGEILKGSVAMAYILRSIDLFQPQEGGVVFVPESLLYSETDKDARHILSKRFDISVLAELQSCTFKGARAHATAIRLTPAAGVTISSPLFSIEQSLLRVKIVRGGLPVYTMCPEQKGIPFIHTTDIPNVVSDNNLSASIATKGISRGQVSGWSILIPRVGIPKLNLFTAVYLRSKVQLSDCVIALKCPDKDTASQLEERVKHYWGSFEKLYRGTGARYITLNRLEEWLISKSIYPEK